MILETAWVSSRCCNLAGASEDEDSGFYQWYNTWKYSKKLDEGSLY